MRTGLPNSRCSRRAATKGQAESNSTKRPLAAERQAVSRPLTMVENVVGVALSLAMTALVADQTSTIGSSVRTLLPEKDVAQITRLATVGHRTPWLMDVDRSMTLPDQWFVDAYLSADSETAALRRGRITRLGSSVVGNIAQRWRVASHGQYAQVARPGLDLRTMVESNDIDRPFRVNGRFSDEELLDLVIFIRTSPRKPAIPDDPDGTSHVEVPDRIDGDLPLLEIKREHNLVRIGLGGSRSGQSVVLQRVEQRWKIKAIVYWVA
jgi:hypothetical protein